MLWISALILIAMGYFLIKRSDRMAMKKGRLVVIKDGAEAIPLMFKPDFVEARFLDTFDGQFPSCNPIDDDRVTATAVRLVGGGHAVELVWKVSREREIFWRARK